MMYTTSIRFLLCFGLLLTLASACSDDAASGDQPDADVSDDLDGGNDLDLAPDGVVDADADALPDVTGDPDVVEDPDVAGDADAGDVPVDAPGDGDATVDAPTDGGDDAAEVGDAVDGGEIGPDAADSTGDPDLLDLADGGDMGGPGPGTGELIDCMRTLPPPSSGTCEVAAGDSRILIRGTILADDTYVDGELLVDASGNIACYGCDCPAAGATVITCAEGVISPGLINGHDHITYAANDPGEYGIDRFAHRHDWRLGLRGHEEIDRGFSSNSGFNTVAWGEMRQVMGGTTSISGSGASDGFLRNLDRAADQEGLGQPEVGLSVFPFGSASGTSHGDFHTQDCSYSTRPSASSASRDSYSPHVSEGIDPEARNEFLCISSSARGGIDVTGSNSAFIHMIPLNPVDGAELVANGASIVWSPRTNISLYGHTAPVTMLAQQGVNIALGTDWTPSGSINLLRELDCVDYLNETYYDGYFSDRDLWLIATENGARAFHIDDVTGLIRNGRRADLAIFALNDAENPYRAIIDAGVEDVVLVLRSGTALYGDAALVAALPGAACELVDFSGGSVCGVAKRICAQRDTGSSLTTIRTANAGSYGLFFCDEPPGEPSCVPFREDEFDGIPTVVDDDGDGVPNADDNCPNVFNAVRPVDIGVQADFDRDGLGDVCDPCPLDPGTVTCAPFDANDRDHDGVPNATDNCPAAYNPSPQADLDSDGIGDVCDRCPDQSNLGGVPCLVTIYDIKRRFVPADVVVSVRGVVTQRDGNAFYIGVPPDEVDATFGAEYSGLLVYIPSANPAGVTLPIPGDLVEVRGETQDYYDIYELASVTNVSVLDPDQLEPTPLTLATDAVTFPSRRATALDSVLVQITGQVTGIYDTNGLLTIDDAIVVDDEFYRIDPEPQLLDTVTVRGLFRLDFDLARVSPRGVFDVGVVGADPQIVSITPGPLFLEVDETDAETHPPLEIRLDRPAPEGGAEIDLASADEDIVTVPFTVTVPQGSRTVTVPATGVASSDTPTDVLASIGDDDPFITQIQVLPLERDPPVLSIEPSELTLLLDDVKLMTIHLEVPVDADGLELTVEADNDALIDITQPDPFVHWDLAGDFLVEGLGEGTVELSVTSGGQTATATLTIVDVPEEIELARFTFDGDSPSPFSVGEGVLVGPMTVDHGTVSWPGGSPSPAMSVPNWAGEDNYFQIEVTPIASGDQLGFTHLAFLDSASGTGPQSFEVQLVTEDDQVRVVATSPTTGGTGTNFQTNTLPIAVDDQGPYQGTVRIRLVGFGATGSTGTWRIDNVVLRGYVL